MTAKWISVAILWLISHYPFANPSVNTKLHDFAVAYPRLNNSPATIKGARNYITKLGLAYGNPYLDSLKESINFLENPTTFNRNAFIGGLSRGSRLTGTFKGISEELLREAQTRATLERLLPK